MGWACSGELTLVALNANRFLEAMSEVTVGWLLLEGAVIAHAAQKELADGHPDAAFYEGKQQAAVYFARNVLSGVEEKAKRLQAEDRSPLEISDAAFATV